MMKLAVLVLLALASTCTASRYTDCNLNVPLVGGANLRPLDCIIPWIVSLRDPNDEHFCGGSLIAPTVVLTAAHCLKRGIPPTVDIGRLKRIGEDESGFETRTVARGIMHEEYNYNFQDNNDIGLLILKEPSAKKVATIGRSDYCFRTERGCEVMLLGWGVTSENGTLAEFLEFGWGRSVESSACDAEFASNFGNSLISDTMICARGHDAAETCLFDSGGPLLVKSQVVGLVSWGTPVCGQSSVPGVYASVPKLRSWLDAKLDGLAIQL